MGTHILTHLEGMCKKIIFHFYFSFFYGQRSFMDASSIQFALMFLKGLPWHKTQIQSQSLVQQVLAQTQAQVQAFH